MSKLKLILKRMMASVATAVLIVSGATASPSGIQTAYASTPSGMQGETPPVGTVATATSAYAGDVPMNAVDGNVNTGWLAPTNRATLQLMFPSAQPISAVQLISKANPQGVVAFTIQGLQNGVWSTISDTARPFVRGTNSIVGPIEVRPGVYDGIKVESAATTTAWTCIMELTLVQKPLMTMNVDVPRMYPDGVSTANVSGRMVSAVGEPMANVPVTLSATGSNGTFAQPVVTTDANGNFSGVYTAGTTEGTVQMTATSEGVTKSASVKVVWSLPGMQGMTPPLGTIATTPQDYYAPYTADHVFDLEEWYGWLSMRPSASITLEFPSAIYLTGVQFIAEAKPSNTIRYTISGRQNGTWSQISEVTPFYVTNHVLVDPISVTPGQYDAITIAVSNTGSAWACIQELTLLPRQTLASAFELTASGSSTSSTTADLTWSSTGAAVDHYVVKRNGQAVYSGTELSFHDGGLVPGTQYAYVVEAFTAQGTSLGTKAVDITTQPYQLTVTAVSSSPTTVDLTFSGNATASNYLVKRNGTIIYEGANSSTRDSGLLPSTAYNYTVETYDAGGVLLGTQTATVTTQEFVLTLNAVSNSPLTVDLSYAANASVVNYVVKRDSIVVYEGASTSYHDAELLPSSEYGYTVDAYDAQGQLLGTQAVTLITQAFVLNASATANNATAIDVAYSANAPVAAYVVKRDGAIIYSGSNTALNDGTLLPNTTYPYTIEAYDAQNRLLDSQTASATTPAFVLNLIGDSSAFDTVALAYSSNGTVARYEVKRGAANVYAGTNTQFTDTALQPGTTYSYTVEAYDANNRLLGTQSITVTTETFDLTLTATPTTLTTITLDYSANGTVAKYVLKRSPQTIYQGTNTSYTDAGLNSRKTYTYILEAYDAQGNLLGSESVTLSTQFALTITKQATTDSITVAYHATGADAANLSYYVVKRDNVIVYQGTDTLYTDRGLDAKTKYRYTVEAYDAQGRILGSQKLNIKTLK